MKEYLKNLFAARGAAFWLNLLGLSMAFVIFYVLMAEVMWHVTFDRFHKDADRVCQVFHKKANPGGYDKYINPLNKETNRVTASFASEIIRSNPAFETSVIHCPKGSHSMLSPTDVKERNDSILVPLIETTAGLLDVFTFDLVEGNAEAYNNPQNVFIPLSLAKKFYGEEGPYIGRMCGEKDKWEAYVGGVYRDFPTNTQLDNGVYRCVSEEQWDRIWKNPGTYNTLALFVKLREGVDKELLSQELLAGSTLLRNEATHFSFLPIHDVYFTESYEGVYCGWVFRKHDGNMMIVWLLALVALLVVMVASINYVNFSMAMIPYQIKNINVRRVFGERAWSIRVRLIGRALFNMLMALFLSWAILTILIQKGVVDEWLKCELPFSCNLEVIGMMGILAVLIPLVAGGYPAWYVTSRKPALVINGSFALSPIGQAFRRTLIGLQFVVSIVSVLMVLLVSGQNHYVRTAPVGYARDSVMYVFVKDYWKMDMNAYYGPLTDAMKMCPDVKDISWANYRLGEDNSGNWSTDYEGNKAVFKGFPVNYNFLTTMGIKITEGRNFCPEDEGRHYIIFNETARKKYNLKLHTYLWGEIIGFCEDIKYGSFKSEMEPLGFVLNEGWGGHCVLRLTSPDRRQKVAGYVNQAFAKVSNGAFEWEISTNADIADAAYAEEMKQLKLLMLVSIVSLLIPLIGVFGLVLFETRARRKEIGIRKVFGATTKGILVMFNAQYLRILVVCFVIAVPVSLHLYNKWIESFAYRTPMHWWLFAGAFLLVAIVICLTVTIQSWRAAKEKPVETIMK